MPDFPKPIDDPPRFHPPEPLFNVRRVFLGIHVHYECWEAAFFPQLEDELYRLVERILCEAGLSVTTEQSDGCPELHFEVTIRTLSLNRGVTGGIILKTESYLQEKCTLARHSQCQFAVITWSHALKTQINYYAQATQEIKFSVEGEVERQARRFVKDWSRDNPGRAVHRPRHGGNPPPVAPPPCVPPVQPPPQQPQVPCGPPQTPAAPLATAGCNVQDLNHCPGVNLVHLEYCSNSADYSNANRGSIRQIDEQVVTNLANRGIKLFRIPICWERLQPDLSEDAFDSTYYSQLCTMIGYVQATGGRVILDLHNSFRYWMQQQGRRNHWFVGQCNRQGYAPVSIDALIKVWRLISAKFAANATVVGYGLMNQPYPPIPNPQEYNWIQASQRIVECLRAEGDTKLVLVDRDNYSTADDWPEELSPWIDDNRVYYQAHLNVRDRSPPIHSLFGPFLEWCRNKRVSGFLGSVQINMGHPDCDDLVTSFLTDVGGTSLGWCYWPPGDDMDLNDRRSPVWRIAPN